MNTQITIQNIINRKIILVWLNSTVISLKNLAVWIIYVKFVEKNLVLVKKCCIFVM